APVELDQVLSPQWLTATVGSRRPGTEVDGVTVVETLQTVATKVRFGVEYSDGTTAAFCVKGYFKPEFRASGSTGQVEVHFYRELAPELGVRVPPCVYTGIDPESGHGLVLMEDLVERGCRFLSPLTPVDVDRAAQNLGEIARLNARYWEAPLLREIDWVAPRMG